MRSSWFAVLVSVACTNGGGDDPKRYGDTSSPAGDRAAGDPLVGGATQLDFVVSTAATADILFVVSNGASMAGEQNALGANASQFLSALDAAGTDYRIGVISTDAAAGGLLHVGGASAVVTPSTTDAANVLAANLAVGTTGVQARAFESAALALGRGDGWEPGDPEVPPNAGFLRRGLCAGTCEGTSTACGDDSECEDAPLTLIFVSDVDDESFGPVRYYWRLFESLRGTGNEGRIAQVALAGPFPDGCVDAVLGPASSGERFAELLAYDNAELWSLCEPIGDAMTSTGYLAARLETRFPLSGTPDLGATLPCGNLTPGPFCVRVNGAPVDGYSYDAPTNAIVFDLDSIPPPGSSVTIAHGPEGPACTAGSCTTGWFCNDLGNCQRTPPCVGNEDCDVAQICDTADPSGGACIPDTSCSSSVQCDLSEFCSATTHQCELGCRSTGDCALGEVCAAGNCVAGATPADCTICPADPMPDASYCDYGEVCTTEGDCVAHPDNAGLCQKPCDDISSPCATSLTCLVDDLGGTYCAPSCNTEGDCPSGYSGCNGTSLVSGPCSSGGLGPCDCTDTGACPNGGQCIAMGSRSYCECVNQDDCDFLVGACFTGTCLTAGGGSCVVDQDCACSNNRCAVGGFPCSTASDCAISCVQVPYGDGTFGQCVTNAKVCGKEAGVSCTELTTGLAECRGL